MKYFSSKRDIDIVNSGGFFCEACLIGKPKHEQSPDYRYCQSCYDVLLKEADCLSNAKRPKWIPKPQVDEMTGKKVIPVPLDVVLNMATVKDKKTEVAIITPVTPIRPSGKRGPKHKALPIKLIAQWASEGMGYKRIATRLKDEHGIEVGFRTVARVVKGERDNSNLGKPENS